MKKLIYTFLFAALLAGAAVARDNSADAMPARRRDPILCFMVKPPMRVIGGKRNLSDVDLFEEIPSSGAKVIYRCAKRV